MKTKRLIEHDETYTYDKSLFIRINSATKHNLMALAAFKGISVADITRSVIEQHIKENQEGVKHGIRVLQRYRNKD